MGVTWTVTPARGFVVPASVIRPTTGRGGGRAAEGRVGERREPGGRLGAGAGGAGQLLAREVRMRDDELRKPPLRDEALEHDPPRLVRLDRARIERRGLVPRDPP